MSNAPRLLSIVVTLVLGVSAISQPPSPTPETPDKQEVKSPAPAGRFEVVKEKVWIPGSTERVWIAPVFTAAVDGEGRPVNVLVEPGYYRTVTIPGRYQMITRKVWVPTSKPVPVTHFTLRNSRRFQIQVQSIHVALADGSTAVVHLPRDNVISSTSHFTFDIPDGAVSVRLRFKTWSWGNKRFQFPIYSAAYELNRSNTGIIH